jgi:hypothetical protein
MTSIGADDAPQASGAAYQGCESVMAGDSTPLRPLSLTEDSMRHWVICGQDERMMSCLGM